MENATKFMYMAFGIIVGVFILAIFAYVFRVGANANKNYDVQKSREQLELSNSLLEGYNIRGLTISDIISVCNLAYSVNEEHDYDKNNSVYIEVRGLNSKLTIPNELNSNESKNLNRNEVLYGNNKIYIYDLMDKADYTSDGTKLSLTQYDEINDETIYRYMFRCVKISYHEITGKVATMEFEMYMPNESLGNW